MPHYSDHNEHYLINTEQTHQFESTIDSPVNITDTFDVNVTAPTTINYLGGGGGAEEATNRPTTPQSPQSPQQPQHVNFSIFQILSN